jgi:hypothetical protein
MNTKVLFTIYIFSNVKNNKLGTEASYTTYVLLTGFITLHTSGGKAAGLEDQDPRSRL